eukprot:79532_1
MNMKEPFNLEIIRPTKHTINIQQKWIKIKSFKQCKTGNKIAMIYNYNCDTKEKEALRTYGIINKVCQNCMTIAIPTDYKNKQLKFKYKKQTFIYENKIQMLSKKTKERKKDFFKIL